MAREKHLTAVHIGNFKRFADFQVENLGQFNLVVGDNNTGKTSFLEALVVDEEKDGKTNINNLKKLLSIRQSFSVEDQELIEEVYSNRGKKGIMLGFQYGGDFLIVSLGGEHFVNNNPFRDVIEVKASAIDSLLGDHNYKGIYLMVINESFHTTYNLGKKVKIFPESNSVYEAKITSLSAKQQTHLNFIHFGAGYDSELVTIYKNEIDRRASRRTKLQENLKLFIPNVVDIRLQAETIIIYEDGEDLGTPLYTYGEGAVKFFRILCYFATVEDKRLMIDEIDTGIHHTKFIQFWTTLMQAATEYDVQLFATTHNEECLEYFQAALEQEELAAQRELARVISLKLRKEQKISAKVYDFKSLQLAEDLGHEIRGGGL